MHACRAMGTRAAAYRDISFQDGRGVYEQSSTRFQASVEARELNLMGLYYVIIMQLNKQHNMGSVAADGSTMYVDTIPSRSTIRLSFTASRQP